MLGESTVTEGLLTALESVPLTSMLFEGQLYVFIGLCSACHAQSTWPTASPQYKFAFNITMTGDIET